MTTACWATNEEFDCAWAYFGYGSRHDMMRSPGYWISLKGLCAIAEYDYDYSPCFSILRSDNHRHRVLAEQFNLDFNGEWHVDFPKELISKLPMDIQMDISPISIVHPNGLEKSVEWYVEVMKHAGKYYKQGYEEKELYRNFGGFSVLNMRIPSMEKIKEINPIHYQWHKNLEDREAVLVEDMRFKPDPMDQYRAKPEDMEAMLGDWEKEANEKHEEFKKKNIWEQL